MFGARFCLLSLLLVVLAIGVHGGALRNWSQSSGLRAKAVSATQGQRVIMRHEAYLFGQTGSALYIVGLCFAVTSAVFLIVSIRRKESAPWRVAPVVLLICYALLQVVMV